jgi:hypothetical protein
MLTQPRVGVRQTPERTPMSINRFGRPFSIPTRYAGAIRTSRSTPILQPITPRGRIRGRGRWGLACVQEDGEEVAGGSGGDEQMPDEMAIRELLGQVKSDPAGVSESAGGQPQ